MSVGYNIDNTQLATGSNKGIVRIYDGISPGCPLYQFEIPAVTDIHSVTYGHSRTQLTVGSNNGNVWIYRTSEIVPETTTEAVSSAVSSEVIGSTVTLGFVSVTSQAADKGTGISDWPLWAKVYLGAGVGVAGLATLVITFCLGRKACNYHKSGGQEAGL